MAHELCRLPGQTHETRRCASRALLGATAQAQAPANAIPPGLLRDINAVRQQGYEGRRGAVACAGPGQPDARHAAHMARHNYFDLPGRDGSRMEERASSGGYRWRAIGENIAGDHTQAEAAMQDWLASPEHRVSAGGGTKRNRQLKPPTPTGRNA